MTHGFLSLDFSRSALNSKKKISKSTSLGPNKSHFEVIGKGPYRPQRKSDIGKTMSSLSGKKKENEIQWVNYEVVITDSDTTEDEAEVSKSPVPADDEDR